MDWQEWALKKLQDSLVPIPAELNELDWKSGLSCKTERLAQHISAFANLRGGGILVFGVNNDGICSSITKDEADKTIQLLGNIAKNNLAYSISIEHAILTYQNSSLLFIYIPEQQDKPVSLRGKDVFDSYIRSAGQTVKMSRNQVKAMIAESQGFTFEEQAAKNNLTAEQVLDALDYRKMYDLLGKNVPSSIEMIINKMEEYGFCAKQNDTLWSITNLGAILFANRNDDFPELAKRVVTIRKYMGTNNRNLFSERPSSRGYAVDFEDMIDFIMKSSSTEAIDVIRKDVPTYPRVAIREFVANALVHQDFAISGMPITIEIFSNRLAITNPGIPLNDINRLIDLPPYSRNEVLAQSLFLLGICERRGSGIDRAVEAIEKMFLPAAKITKGENFTRVFLFPKKDLKNMTKSEKINACYQHTCLMYEDNKAINNQSIRERFNLDKNKSSVASRIIADTVEAGLIKLADADITSKKYATYIPYYG